MNKKSRNTEVKKDSSGLDFLGSRWIPYVVRNMSFWHMYANFPGYFKYFPDFGISKGLDVISITLDGIHTHVYVREPNFSEVGNLIKNLWLTPSGSRQIAHLYKKYAQELLSSLSIVKKNLTIKTWRKFIVSYERFTVALNITAVFGRTGMNEFTSELLKLGFKETEIPNMISAATYPSAHTPLFLSRLDLYTIAVNSIKGKWNEKKRTNALLLWLKKYQHVPVNFCEEPWTLADAHSQLAQIEIGNPSQGFKNLKIGHDARVGEAKKMQKKIRDKSLIRLADAIAHATILNEFRKNVFSKVSLEYRSIFKIAAQSGGSNNWRDCFYINPDEMKELLFGKPYSLADFIRERTVIAHFVAEGKIHSLPEETKKKFLRHINSMSGKFQPDNNEEKNIKEIKGYSASRGKVKGIVKIIYSSKDFGKMNSGDILVAPATSVDFVPVMEKAAAFVTNEGGITSHASIVSREMGKPCIIGTKIATKVLKDGDLVEVDADKGTIKIIK